MKNYTIITKKATILDSDGYIQNSGVEVTDHGDTIGIDGSGHLKSDLVIEDNKITSKIGGWELTW